MYFSENIAVIDTRGNMRSCAAFLAGALGQKPGIKIKFMLNGMLVSLKFFRLNF